MNKVIKSIIAVSAITILATGSTKVFAYAHEDAKTNHTEILETKINDNENYKRNTVSKISDIPEEFRTEFENEILKENKNSVTISFQKFTYATAPEELRKEHKENCDSVGIEPKDSDEILATQEHLDSLKH